MSTYRYRVDTKNTCVGEQYRTTLEQNLVVARKIRGQIFRRDARVAELCKGTNVLSETISIHTHVFKPSIGHDDQRDCEAERCEAKCGFVRKTFDAVVYVLSVRGASSRVAS